MSAAAAIARVVTKVRKFVAKITDQQRTSTVPALKGQWTATENGYYDILPTKTSSFAEYIAIGQVIRRSYGGKDRLEFVQLPAAELAELAKCTEDGAEKALKLAVEHGFLDVVKDGRKYKYRVVLSAFAVPEDKKPREIERKPAKPENEFRPVAAVRVFIEPGTCSDPIALTPSLNARVRNGLSFPVDVASQQGDDGMLDIAIAREGAGEEVANHRLTPVRQSNRHEPENKSKHESRREVGLLRDFLVRWCGSRFEEGPPTDNQVTGILAALNGHSRDRLAHKIKAWLPTARSPRWTDIEGLARSLGDERQDRRPPREASVSADKKANGKAVAPLDDKFQVFMDASTAAEFPASEEDWKKASKLWGALSIEHQIAAVQFLRECVENGTVDRIDVFPRRPDAYLRDKAWQRGLLRKRTSYDPKEAGREEAMKWAIDVTSGRR